MNLPKKGGTIKPGAAARHVPAGHQERVKCPVCKGRGTVALDSKDDLKRHALRRV